MIAGTYMWWLLPCWIAIYFSLAPVCLMDDASCFRVLHLCQPCPLCCNESLLWHWWNSCMYYSHGGCETCCTSICHHLPKNCSKIQFLLSTVTGLVLTRFDVRVGNIHSLQPTCNAMASPAQWVSSIKLHSPPCSDACFEITKCCW